MPLRDGLHQAVEMKEGLAICADNRPIGRISKQRYYSLYRHLCGMTGTAQESVGEFWRIFRMRVVVVPPRRPCRRKSYRTRLFATAESKYAAIVQETERLHGTGQPVLIGTRTIENSERVARGLTTKGIPFQLLNGKQDLDEATIISLAGKLGAVTIATNMAGRGTEIRLQPGVAELGGLHVIATEPNESVRVDRQLFGRAARKAIPGRSSSSSPPKTRCSRNTDPALRAFSSESRKAAEKCSPICRSKFGGCSCASRGSSSIIGASCSEMTPGCRSCSPSAQAKTRRPPDLPFPAADRSEYAVVDGQIVPPMVLISDEFGRR